MHCAVQSASVECVQVLLTTPGIKLKKKTTELVISCFGLGLKYFFVTSSFFSGETALDLAIKLNLEKISSLLSIKKPKRKTSKARKAKTTSADRVSENQNWTKSVSPIRTTWKNTKDMDNPRRLNRSASQIRLGGDLRECGFRKAKEDYTAKNESELSFKAGELIQLISVGKNGVCTGSVGGNVGTFLESLTVPSRLKSDSFSLLND